MKKFNWKKKYGQKQKPSHIDDAEMRVLNEKLEHLKETDMEKFAKTVEKFSDFPLSSKTLKGLTEANYEVPTEIQRCAILPGLLGFDVLGGAKTGSGKTLAFIIPILEKLYKEKWSRMDGLGALIVSPTRELALQTYKVLQLINKYHKFSFELVIGGKFLKEERDRILQSNIVICTPGRLQQHLESTVNFRADNLHILVLDEADRILDLGFQQQMTEIVENLPTERQTLFFSATQTRLVRDLARVSMRVPVLAFTSDLRRQITPTPSNLKQNYIVCPLANKLNTLWSFVKNYLKSKIVVFMATCKQVRFVHEAFRRLRPGITLLLLHSKMKYTKRLSMYESFVRKQHAVLFATDIAARGLDFPDIDWVVHVDCPVDINTYIHRSGRTARCDKQGSSLLVLLPSEEQGMISLLSEKKVPIKKIKIDRRKRLSIAKKLASLCAADVTLKEFAQRGFVSYLKSIVMASNKKIFDVSELDLEAYALSLGLACAPTVRFVKKGKQQTTADPKAAIVDKPSEKSVDEEASSVSDSDSCDDDDDDDDDSDDDSSSRDESLAFPSKSKAVPVSLNNLSDDDDDDILIKKTSPSEKTLAAKSSSSLQLISERNRKDDVKVPRDKATKQKETKYAAAKKILKKKLVVNSKVVFDEEGEAVADAYKQPHTVMSIANDESNEIGGIDISVAKSRLKQEDLFDKQLYRDKIKQKHREKRLKEKEKRKKKRQPGADDNHENEDDIDEPDLDFLPDPDKIYGPQIETDDDEDNQKRIEKPLRGKKGKDNGDSDDSFNSCDYDVDDDATARKLKTKKRTKKRKLTAEDSRTSAKRRRSSRDSESDNVDDYDTGRSLVDDEALALKLLNS